MTTTTIALKTAFVLSAAMYLIPLFTGLSAALFVHAVFPGPEITATLVSSNIQEIIDYAIELTDSLNALLRTNNPDMAELREHHNSLTVFIQTYEAIYEGMTDFIIRLDHTDSDYFDRGEDVHAVYRGIGTDMMKAYRLLEARLGIVNSPIALEDWEEE